MSAPVVMSMVTTVASIVTCVPNFQFLGLGVNPVPDTCTGRKKREMDDFSDDQQFHIVPSETQKYLNIYLFFFYLSFSCRNVELLYFFFFIFQD